MCWAFYLANSCEQTVIACTLVEFLGDSDGKESACNAGDLGLILGQEDPLEKGMATHSSFNCLCFHF